MVATVAVTFAKMAVDIV